MTSESTVSVLKTKVLPALGHAAATVAVYLIVKHMTRGLSYRDVWVAVLIAAAVGVATSLPWWSKHKGTLGSDQPPPGRAANLPVNRRDKDGGRASMAQALRFVCDNCRRAVEAWSDGNPYYIDQAGTKQYAYHPDHERLALCVGNDSPHLCLECVAEFNVDSRAPLTACPTCGSFEIADTYGLDGRRCPYCKAGRFTTDPDFHAIS